MNVKNYKYILGVDFGTTSTFLSKKMNGREPKIVPIDGKDQNETVLRLGNDGNSIEEWGTKAWEEYELNPTRTFGEFKPHVGTDKKYEFQDNDDKGNSICRTFSADELSKIFLTELCNKFKEQTLNNARISPDDYCTQIGYPADWELERQKKLLQITQEAGFPNVSVISEPEAIVAWCRKDNALELLDGEKVLVFDFGGGTTDLAIIAKCNGELKCEGSGGNGDLGGRRFDNAIAEHIAASIIDKHKVSLSPADYSSIKKYARKLKEELSIKIAAGKSDAQVTIPYLQAITSHFICKLNKDEFIKLVHNLISETEGCIKNFTPFNINRLNKVILAGGSVRLPFVSELFTGIKDINILRPERPQELVVLGLLEDDLPERVYYPSPRIESIIDNYVNLISKKFAIDVVPEMLANHKKTVTVETSINRRLNKSAKALLEKMNHEAELLINGNIELEERLKKLVDSCKQNLWDWIISLYKSYDLNKYVEQRRQVCESNCRVSIKGFWQEYIKNIHDYESFILYFQRQYNKESSVVRHIHVTSNKRSPKLSEKLGDRLSGSHKRLSQR